MASNKQKYALQLQKCFGFNRQIRSGVLNLSNNERNAVFYVTAHTGVIHDLETGTQVPLQGHSNAITCVTASIDRRWVATADAGEEDCMVVVWDSVTGVPVKTLFRPHAGGVTAMHMCEDASILATVGCDENGEQSLSLWAWTEDTSAPIASVAIPAGSDIQTCVRFHRQDASQVVTNGKTSVFLCAMLDDGTFDVYAPQIDPADFKQGIGEFTQSLFIPDSSEVISATVDGDVIVWDESMLLAPPDENGDMRKQAVKIIKLHTHGAINFMDMTGDNIVTGGSDGYVRFYDFKLRMVAWFDYFNNGAITSVDFCRTGKPLPAVMSAENFDCEDFLFGTTDGQIVTAGSELLQQLEIEDRRGTVVVQGFDGAVVCTATHPSAPFALASTSSGKLYKLDLAGSILGALEIPTMAAMEYTPDGSLAICGAAADGQIFVLDSETLDEVQALSVLEGGIKKVAVATDGLAFATVDNTRATSIFRFMVDPEARVGSRLDETEMLDGSGAQVKTWVYVGSYRAHYKPVVSLTWGGPSTAGGNPRLWSVGEDGYLVEYDIEASSITEGVSLAKRERILHECKPTAVAYAPNYGGEYLREGVLIIADDQYKVKVQRTPDTASESSTCRKTVLGPTYGEPPSIAKVLPGGEYMLYATPNKVIGLVRLPLDGNPARCIGMVAHPGEVSDCAVGVMNGEGALAVVTAGGGDDSLMLWSVDTEAAAAVEAIGGAGMDPFYNLLEGGKGGSQHEELIDYFYYAQLVAQGESSVAPRVTGITQRVPFEQTADLLRAAGYHPSDRQAAEIVEELRYAQHYATGRLEVDLSFEALMQTLVNHRPVVGIGPEEITAAFAALGASANTGLLTHGELLTQLSERREGLGGEELDQCWEALLGSGQNLGSLGSSDISPAEMAEGVLGFAGDKDAAEQDEEA